MHENLSDEALKELYIRGGMTDWGYEALVKEMYERGYSNYDLYCLLDYENRLEGLKKEIKMARTELDRVYKRTEELKPVEAKEKGLIMTMLERKKLEKLARIKALRKEVSE